MRRKFVCAAVGGALFGLLACGGGSETEVLPPNTKVLRPEAPPLPGETECKVTEVTKIEPASANHQPTCTDIDYPTNPPSGGDHWAVWAAFKKYDTPVPREMYVHNLEHGTIVLLYRCAGACEDVVAALGKVFDEAGDEACSPSKRLLLTPDPDLDTPIAAAAWGATYTATCIDTASLAAFVKANIGKGPEEVCTSGADVSAASPCP